MEEWDAVVIGAGHNGLIAAAYLARAGARVLVAERRPIVGGACVTEEPWPGFRINTFAYASGLLRPKIVEELELRRFGYEPILPDPQVFAPLPGGRSLTFWVDEERNAKEIARFSKADARAYPKYVAYWDEVLAILEPALLAPPVPIAEFLPQLPDDAAERLLRDLFLRSARDFLDDWFESEELKGVLASASIIGAFSGPGTPGTAYILAHHNIGTLDGHSRVWGHTRGGMGRIADAIAASARSAGATIQVGTAVRRIVVEGDRAAGVELETGRIVRSRVVLSSVDVSQTFFRLLEADALDPEFARRARQVRSRGAVLKFNAALSTLPRFTAAADPTLLRGAVDISPSMDYLDRAFDEAKYGSFSQHPYIDAYFQSTVDPSVAPPGHHTMTCFVQYAPTKLRTAEWASYRPDAAEIVLATLEEYAPGIRNTVETFQVITPSDIEATLGMTGGSIDQGDISPDQIFSMRPVPGWSQYRTPIPGLYLCGAATHPGGGVIGAAGHNAAEVALGDLKGGRPTRDS